jgi:predicted ATP-grasp superfamily ATP-dependent carboligase
VRALIVEDGFQRGALAGCRALGRAGWAIGIGSARPGFASSSRYARAWHHVPPPEEDEPAFLQAVRSAIEAGGYELVFAAGDSEAVALSAGRAQLQAIFPYAPHADVIRAFDKVELEAAAQRAGLRTPERVGPDDAPVIVKPRRTTVRGPDGAPLRLRAELAETPEEARERTAYLESVGAEPLLQRYVEGSLVAYVAVTDRESRVVAAVQQRALSVWPSRSGGSVRAETVEVDRELAERVGALLADLSWFGIAQTQFQSPPNGEAVLIDLNGRFYGSLALALAAGPNLPAIWAALATGRRLPPLEPARIGVRYHWLEMDLRRAAQLRSLRAAATSAAWALRARHGLWDAGDPRPAARHVARLALRLARRSRRQRAARRS